MDRTTRRAALWATLVALPLTVLLALYLAGQVTPESEEPAPTAGTGAPAGTSPSPGASGALAGTASVPAGGAGAPAGALTPSVSPVPSARVPMAAAALTERQAVLCRALLSRLPVAVRHLAQRPVTAGPEQNAAYGAPALTVACGVPPATYPPTADLWTVNRVCWYAAQESDAVVLSTVDREVPVRVTVPRVYEQPLQWVSEISETLVASVPSAATVPSGCRP